MSHLEMTRKLILGYSIFILCVKKKHVRDHVDIPHLSFGVFCG